MTSDMQSKCRRTVVES